MADKKPAAEAPTQDAPTSETPAIPPVEPVADVPAAPVAPVAPVQPVAAKAPAKPADKKPAAEGVPEKPVFLLPVDTLKHVLTFGGHPRLFIKPGAPTEITQKTYQELLEDVGFNNLIAAGKISVMA